MRLILLTMLTLTLLVLAACNNAGDRIVALETRIAQLEIQPTPDLIPFLCDAAVFSLGQSDGFPISRE